MPEAGAPKAKLAIFISGRGSNMAALLYASRMADATYEVVLVASNDPEADGLAFAEAEGIATYALSHRGMDRAAHDQAMGDAARAHGAEAIALAGYMRILSAEFVLDWEGRLFNIHPSLLPKYKGLETHARAIAAGDSHGGASVHLVTPELDDGEVLGQAQVAVRPDDTPDSLAARVLIAEHQLYPRVIGEYLARPYDRQWIYSRLRELALTLPEVEERESHGAPGFHTGGKSGKFFAHFSDRHHGEPHIAVLLKTSGADEMAALMEQDPDIYYRPAYYGASGWIGLVLNRPDVDWAHVRHWLDRSWASVAPARLAGLRRAAAEF